MTAWQIFGVVMIFVAFTMALLGCTYMLIKGVNLRAHTRETRIYWAACPDMLRAQRYFFGSSLLIVLVVASGVVVLTLLIPALFVFLVCLSIYLLLAGVYSGYVLGPAADAWRRFQWLRPTKRIRDRQWIN